MYAAKLYSYAKENSGPLKTGVDTVEGTVKTVVGLFTTNITASLLTFSNSLIASTDRNDVFDLMKTIWNDEGVLIADSELFCQMVDESMNKVQSRVPPTLKQVSTQAFETAQKAPAAARSVMSEVKTAGVVGTASGLAKTMYAKYEPAAKDIYSKYEPVAEQYAVSAWRSLNQLPLFPRMAQAVGPTASYYSEKYNQTVQIAAEKGYKVASHLPLVPTERIAKALTT
ncbi:hypothetical protein DH2020_024280 [Rehmannia glutinosa]|uniref:Stress-related protein n=1 Tax=Rehmannia glutinosa TaxID=99300 RepID=A0ABR0W967_REHGL